MTSCERIGAHRIGCEDCATENLRLELENAQKSADRAWTVAREILDWYQGFGMRPNWEEANPELRKRPDD